MTKRRPAQRVAPDVLADVAAAGAGDAGDLPVELLGEFLDEVVAAVGAGSQIPPARLRRYRNVGDRAARQGIALRALLDLYLSAAWRLWRHLPAVRDVRLEPEATVVAGEVVLHAVDDVVAALTEGYQLARRTLARAQESARREFVDDLLGGAADVVRLLRRAGGFGLDLSGPHAVATVQAEREFSEDQPLVAMLDRSVQGSKADAPALVATKDGRLVAVFAAPDRLAIKQVVGQLAGALDKARGARNTVGAWRISVGRAREGADGVVASYRESLEALDLAGRLGSSVSIVDAADLLVYQVLVRDRAGLHDLVDSTLGGLRSARGGAVPLVATLDAWFASGGNTTAAARALHLSVRATSYRLNRVRQLTGLDPDAAEDRFRLHVATLGARLIDWTAAGT